MYWVGLQVKQSLKSEGANDHGIKRELSPEPNIPDPSENSKPKRRKRGRRARKTKRSVAAPKRRCLSDDDLNRKSALIPRAPLLMYHRGRGYNPCTTQVGSDASGNVSSENANPPSGVVSDSEAPPPNSQPPAVEMSLDEDTTQSESDDSETESNGPFSPSHQ